MAHQRSRYLSRQAVAAEMGVSVWTVSRRIADGTLPAYRIGGRIRILESDVSSMVRPIPCSAAR